MPEELVRESVEPIHDDDVRLYKLWVSEALTGKLTDDIKALRKMKNRIEFDSQDERLLKSHHLLDVADAFAQSLEDAIRLEVESTVTELNANVFNRTYFGVSVVIDEKTFQVDSVVGVGDRVSPVIDGEPYDGQIDKVIIHD